MCPIPQILCAHFHSSIIVVIFIVIVAVVFILVVAGWRAMLAALA